MAETIHIEVGDDNVRYGISPLSTKYVADAENDEMLIREKDGKIYYKREDDGQVVTYDKTTYDKLQLVQNMILAHKMDKGVNISDIYTSSDIQHTVQGTPSVSKPLKYKNDLNNYGVVYQTTNIAYRKIFREKDINANTYSDTYKYIDLNTIGKIEINSEYTIPNDIDPYGFYIRIRGNDELNAFMSYIKYPRNYIIADIQYNIGNQTFYKDYPIGFNTLIHIDREALSLSKTSNINSIILRSIRIDSAIGELDNDILKTYNLTSILEPTNIDIITYTELSDNNINNLFKPSDDNVSIIDIIKLKDFKLLTDGLSGGGDISIIDNTDVINNIGNNDRTLIPNTNAYIIYKDYTGEDDGFISKKYSPTSNIIECNLNGSTIFTIPILKIVKNINTINLPKMSVVFKIKVKDITTSGTINFYIEERSTGSLGRSTYDISNLPDSNNDSEDVIIQINHQDSKINLPNYDFIISLNNNTGNFKLYIYDFKILPYSSNPIY